MSFSKMEHDERLPLYQRLHDEMLDKITRREWRPGEAIPTEAELSKSYGLAVGTARKAVEMLVVEGWVERSQGRGTFVCRPNFDASLFRFFRYLTAAGKRKVPEGRVLSCSLAVPPSEVVAGLKLKKQLEAILLKRLRLINERVVLAEEIWLPPSRFTPLLKVELAEFGNLLYPFYEERCGQVVASAQETLTAEAASAAVAERLGINEGQAVIVIERLALAYNRHPLEWRRSYGAADIFRYQVEIG